jgi:hypothetical protein
MLESSISVMKLIEIILMKTCGPVITCKTVLTVKNRQFDEIPLTMQSYVVKVPYCCRSAWKWLRKCQVKKWCWCCWCTPGVGWRLSKEEEVEGVERRGRIGYGRGGLKRVEEKAWALAWAWKQESVRVWQGGASEWAAKQLVCLEMWVEHLNHSSVLTMRS